MCYENETVWSIIEEYIKLYKDSYALEGKKFRLYIVELVCEDNK